MLLYRIDVIGEHPLFRFPVESSAGNFFYRGEHFLKCAAHNYQRTIIHNNPNPVAAGGFLRGR